MLGFYIPVKYKFVISGIFAIAWGTLSIHLAKPWMSDLESHVGSFLAYFSIYGIAIIPGMMNGFLVMSLLLDKRPPLKELDNYPDVTILISAYNESRNLISTVMSIARQKYPGKVTTIIINDGSKDDTAVIARQLEKNYSFVQFLDLPQNVGKANALNEGLKLVETDITITVDGDCYLYKDALIKLVGRYCSDPKNTVAVAGAVLVRNSRENIITKVQEWDYFHGIAAVKRLQSLYQGTMVAHGAFSLYRTDVLREVKGWPHTVGEDIVLTWAMLSKGYRVGFAEDACTFTNAPDNLSQFIKQRQRWSRGLVEAFKAHPEMLVKKRYSTLFVWWNLIFPYLDLTYTLVFLPGVIGAMFGYYWIVGLMTLILLPLSLTVNGTMFFIQRKMFKSQGLKVRRNIVGFIGYSLFYSAVLQPACVYGYLKELFCGSVKSWGTK